MRFVLVSLVALFAYLAVAGDADAGIFRRRGGLGGRLMQRGGCR